MPFERHPRERYPHQCSCRPHEKYAGTIQRRRLRRHLLTKTHHPPRRRRKFRRLRTRQPTPKSKTLHHQTAPFTTKDLSGQRAEYSTLALEDEFGVSIRGGADGARGVEAAHVLSEEEGASCGQGYSKDG